MGLQYRLQLLANPRMDNYIQQRHKLANHPFLPPIDQRQALAQVGDGHAFLVEGAALAAWLGTQQQQTITQAPTTVRFATMHLLQQLALQHSRGFLQAGDGHLRPGALRTQQLVERPDQHVPVHSQRFHSHCILLGSKAARRSRAASA